MAFDAKILKDVADDKRFQVCFQNNINSIFTRVRLLYGSTPIEDIISYNQIVRSITEWTGPAEGSMDGCSIDQGIGSYSYGYGGSGGATDVSGTITGHAIDPWATGMLHTRKNFIHGYSVLTNGEAVNSGVQEGTGMGIVPNVTEAVATTKLQFIDGKNPVRRYQVALALGLFQQEKLIPVKFMASQLAIELSLAPAADCLIDMSSDVSTLPASYQISNVTLLPEILEFDASYDESFIKGLQEGGVPMKFATWNTYRFPCIGTSMNLQITERSRSVKSIFAVQKRDPTSIQFDSGATFFNSYLGVTNGFSGGTTMNEYQFRIGGRYFPAQPVQLSIDVGGTKHNGGVEAWVELQKALNCYGDRKLTSASNTLKWAMNPYYSTSASDGLTTAEITDINGSNTTYKPTLPEYDYSDSVLVWLMNGTAISRNHLRDSGTQSDMIARAGNIGSCCFASSIDLETSNGAEISGLNAEEQSDITFITRFSHSQGGTTGVGNQVPCIWEVYTYVDAMIVLRENNLMELIV